MKLYLPDVNILIYALREEAPAHDACVAWFEGLFERGDALLLAELVEVAFLRISTLPSLKVAPFDVTFQFLTALRNYPCTRRLGPGEHHQKRFEQWVTELNLAGNDLTDAWLAALAIEHEAVLVSANNGFGRFSGLRWINPIR